VNPVQGYGPRPELELIAVAEGHSRSPGGHPGGARGGLIEDRLLGPGDAEKEGEHLAPNLRTNGPDHPRSLVVFGEALARAKQGQELVIRSKTIANRQHWLDKKTSEWIEVHEFPMRAVLSGRNRPPNPGSVVVCALDERTIDWLDSQDFPTRPMVYPRCTDRRTTQTPLVECAVRLTMKCRSQWSLKFLDPISEHPIDKASRPQHKTPVIQREEKTEH
jgi:hypothetical protein